MSNELTLYRYDILASLYWIPCTLSELSERDFCANLPKWYIEEVLVRLERLNLIYERKDGVYCVRRKRARNMLNSLGYEVD